MNPPRALLAAGLTVGAMLVPASSAFAVHWAFFGGDNGRSGLQPQDEGAPPVGFLYAKTGGSEANVQTSIINSTGIPGVQELIYGTEGSGAAAGNLHLQRLSSGAPVGPEAGVLLDDGADDADTWTGAGGSVTPSDVSVAAGEGLTQVYAVYNDDDSSAAGGATTANDIAIAQVNESTGALVKDVPVPGTDGFTISSSTVATGPAADDPATAANETGNRILFFVASDGANERLFRIAITNNANTTASVINPATSTGDVNATPLASPTLVFLADPGSGNPRPFIAVGTTDDRVRTFAVNDLSAGPVSDVLGGDAQTPSVPVAPIGFTPGAPMSGATQAGAIFVAAAAGATTVAHRLVQGTGADRARLALAASSDPLAGAPAPALAVDERSLGTTFSEGSKIVVTTSENLFLLSAGDLSRAGTLSARSLTAGTTGFSRTTAIVTGPNVYVTRDNGAQLVLRLSDAKPVPGREFTEAAGNPPGVAFGQPSISRGFVQFASSNGIFVYRNRDTTAPSIALTAPSDAARVAGTVGVAATAFDARGITSVSFRLDGREVANDATPDSGSEFGGAGNPNPAQAATYSSAVHTTRIANGTYTLAAVATDRGGVTATSAPRTITVDNPPAAQGRNPGRSTARRLSLRVRPRRDARPPHRFTSTGRLSLPANVTRQQACFGRVYVIIKAGKRTISTRPVRLSRTCSFRSKVAFTLPSRFRGVTRLKVQARFQGNQQLKPRRSPTVTLRVR